MKVSVATHGGFAAGLNIGRAPTIIDTEKLPADDARELLGLIDAAVRAGPAPAGSPDRARDAMSYTITLQNGDAPTVLRQSDTDMTPEFGALLDWLASRPLPE